MANIKQTVDLTQGTLSNLIVEDGKLKLPNVNAPTFTRSSIAYKSDGSQVAVNVPRFEAGKFGQGIMIEEGTTNKLLYSEDFSVANWLKNYCSIQSNIATAPNGTTTADKLVEDTTNNSHYLTQDITVSTTTPTVALSLYVKPAERTKIQIYLINDGVIGANFDLTTLTATDFINQATVISKSITPIGNGWYRLTVCGSVTFSSTSANFVIRLLDNSGVTYTGDGVSGIYIWGATIEEKPYPTSYVATTSATSTRAAETLTIPTAGVLNPQEGTVEFLWNPQVPASGIISQATSPKLLQIGTYYSNASLTLWAIHNSGAEPYLRLCVKGQSSAGWSLSATVKASGSGWYKPGEFHYFAISWVNGNNFKVYMDGVLIGGPYTIADPITSWAGGIAYFPGDGNGTDIKGTTNSLIDDLRISSRARTDAEILSAYQSNQSLPIDENTTYALRFDNNLKVVRGGYRRNKIYLQSLGICQGSHIEWSAEIPTNTTAKVYTSLDDVNFTEAVNGAAIEGLSEGVSLSDKALTIKQIMTTEDAESLPYFTKLQYSISGKVYLRG